MTNQPLVSINLVFHKDRSFFEPFLDSIKTQTYPNIETNILDTHEDNIGFWAGQEKLLNQSKGKYIVCMSDVVLDKHFVKKAVEVMERDEKIGALQAKVLQSDGLIDTTGFQIFKTRRIINRGKQTRNEYPEGEIFAVEGAVPFFRKTALDDCKMPPDASVGASWLIDPDFRIGPFGYGDDLDLSWRMKNFGWKQWYSPNVIAFHDRSTSGPRAQIPIIKRQLDWRNVRFAIIKNDDILQLLKYFPFWVVRELSAFIYAILFEPGVLKAAPGFIKLLPCMLSRRKIIRNRMKNSAQNRLF